MSRPPPKQLTRRHLLALQAGLLVPSWLLATPARAAAPLVLVPIVAPDSPERDLALGTLERVFLGKPVEDSAGRRFVPFNQPPKTRPRVLFDQVVLGMTPEEVARYWVDQRIRGKGQPPRSVPSVSLLKQVVRRFPGAIAYIATGELDGTVRALTVGGMSHNSPSYPIRR